MHVKKPILMDENSWLIPYVRDFFQSITLPSNKNMWDQLVEYYGRETCDYLSAGQPTLRLLPLLQYSPDNNVISLVDVEWVCEPIYQLLTADYLLNDKVTPVDPHNESLSKNQPENQGKLQKFLSRWRKKAEANEQADETENINPTNALALITDTNTVDAAAKVLMAANELSLSEAKELLFLKSYARKFKANSFVNILQNAHLMGEVALIVNIDVSYLFDTGFFQAEDQAFADTYLSRMIFHTTEFADEGEQLSTGEHKQLTSTEELRQLPKQLPSNLLN